MRGILRTVGYISAEKRYAKSSVHMQALFVHFFNGLFSPGPVALFSAHLMTKLTLVLLMLYHCSKPFFSTLIAV